MKKVIFIGGVILFVMAAASLYVGLTGLFEIQSASSYEDKGVHIFSPYRTFPTQVENTTTGRQQRLYPTKTVYLVCYRATDGTGYESRDEVSDRSTAENIVSAGEPVERRVLSIKETGNYITIADDLTAESYASGRLFRYRILVGVPVVYLVIYLAAWVVVLRKRHRETVKK